MIAVQLSIFDVKPTQIDVNEAPFGFFHISKYSASSQNVCSECSCGGELKQSRSGSKVAYCSICNNRYVARKK